MERNTLLDRWVCSSPAKKNVRTFSGARPTLGISDTLSDPNALADPAGFFSLARNSGLPPGIIRAQSATSDCSCLALREREDTFGPIPCDPESTVPHNLR